MSKKKRSGLWEHLDALGISSSGTDEEIAAAKLAYRKQYLLQYKQAKRLSNGEFPVLLSKENGEYETIAKAARRHRLSISAFLRVAALGYLTQTYIIPDPRKLSQLELMLAACLNEIRAMAQTKSRQHWLFDQKYEAMEERIERLEREVLDLFRHPLSLVSYVRSASAEEKQEIFHILKHDDRQD